MDTSKIPGYEDMTVEEKLSALENYEIPDPEHNGYVKKSTFDKTAHDLATKKKELRAKLNADEQAELERQERFKAMEDQNKSLEDKYNKLLTETEIAKTKSKFQALGYDEQLAESTAAAMINGDREGVFKNQQKFLESYKKSIEKELLNATPKPENGGIDNSGMTKDKFDKLGYLDKTKYIAEHPDWKKELRI